jgi:insertion element IS1 protein InsB
MIAFIFKMIILYTNSLKSQIKTGEIMPACPKCNSSNVIKNGSIFSGKKKFMCNDCNRQFVDSPSNKIIKDEEWDIVDRLLLERMPISAISRVMNISRGWLHEYIKIKRESVSNTSFQMSTKEKICIEADELWSFVGRKENEAWVWLAIERKTRLIVGFFVGKRDAEGALGLWNSLSEDCKNNGIFFTDGLEAYKIAFPEDRHRIVSKKSGKTSLIERLNLTFRQRISSLVRKTLSFSRKIENLQFIVSNFVRHYNECKAFN